MRYKYRYFCTEQSGGSAPYPNPSCFYNLSPICMYSVAFHTDVTMIGYVICWSILNNMSLSFFLFFFKVCTWTAGVGCRKMSKHRFRDSGWTAGPRLGSCDGEERLQSVETSYTQQSPLRIQRSANSQSHMCNQSNADKAHIPLSLSYFCTLGSSWHLVVSIFVICFFGMFFFFFFPRLNLLYLCFTCSAGLL